MAIAKYIVTKMMFIAKYIATKKLIIAKYIVRRKILVMTAKNILTERRQASHCKTYCYEQTNCCKI
jgi:hypothetical protein